MHTFFMEPNCEKSERDSPTRGRIETTPVVVYSEVCRSCFDAEQQTYVTIHPYENSTRIY